LWIFSINRESTKCILHTKKTLWNSKSFSSLSPSLTDVDKSFFSSFFFSSLQIKSVFKTIVSFGMTQPSDNFSRWIFFFIIDFGNSNTTFSRWIFFFIIDWKFKYNILKIQNQQFQDKCENNSFRSPPPLAYRCCWESVVSNAAGIPNTYLQFLNILVNQTCCRSYFIYRLLCFLHYCWRSYFIYMPICFPH
jgi:hypothetical protein